MITTNAQWGAVRPSGFRKKPRHLDVMRSQHGMATQQVIAGKERQQRDEETAFDRQTAQQDLAMQQAKYKQDKKNYSRQKKLGYANTGINLLNTIMGFF